MTEEEIINIAWNIFPISDKKRNENFIALLVHFARKIAEKEREECAKVCDAYDNGRYSNAADLCAESIRARGQE